MITYITDCCGGGGAEGISDQEAADQESNQEGGEGLFGRCALLCLP